MAGSKISSSSPWIAFECLNDFLMDYVAGKKPEDLENLVGTKRFSKDYAYAMRRMLWHALLTFEAIHGSFFGAGINHPVSTSVSQKIIQIKDQNQSTS